MYMNKICMTSLVCDVRSPLSTHQPMNLTYVYVHVFKLSFYEVWFQNHTYAYTIGTTLVAFRAIGPLKLNLNFRLVKLIIQNVSGCSFIVSVGTSLPRCIHVYLNEVNFINDGFSVFNFQCWFYILCDRSFQWGE